VSCYTPHIMTRCNGGVVFGRLPRVHGGGSVRGQFEVPCLKCEGCRNDRAKMFTDRMLKEAQMWECNRFITLTYSEEALKLYGWSLEYSHFQRFMYRLRKRLGPKVRFFMCGEYGGETSRPHFHACLFNCRFPDERKRYDGNLDSLVLERLWGDGIATLAPFTSGRAGYVAGYVSKADRLRSVDVIDRGTGEVVMGRRREFQQMSRRPGIGFPWFQKFGADVFPNDVLVVDGEEHRVPRYFTRKYLETASEAAVLRLKRKRYKKAQIIPKEEKSAHRRAVMAERAALLRKRRSL